MCSLPFELATSPDGLHWTRFDGGTPTLADDYVLVRDSAVSWDSASIETPTIVVNGSTLRMWFNATRRLPCETDVACISDPMCTQRCTFEHYTPLRIGYAESTDGIHWTKYDDPSTSAPELAASDPVFGPQPGAWDTEQASSFQEPLRANMLVKGGDHGAFARCPGLGALRAVLVRLGLGWEAADAGGA